MGVRSIFKGGLRVISFISLTISWIGLFCQYTITLIWWSRLDPWFSEGREESFKVQDHTLSCYAISIVALVSLAILTASWLTRVKLFLKIYMSKVASIIFLLIFAAMAVTSFILAILTSTDALKEFDSRDEIVLDVRDLQMKNKKCSKYVIYGYFSLLYNRNFNYSHTTPELFGVKYNITSKSLAYDTPKYICDEVAYPTIIFSVIQIIGSTALIVLALTKVFVKTEDSDMEDLN